MSLQIVNFAACTALINYTRSWALTVYEDGVTLISQRYTDEAAQAFGYDDEAGRRLSCEHDLVHHWLADHLSLTGSLNHWLVAHGFDLDTLARARGNEERLIAGVMMLMRSEHVPEFNIWTTQPNTSSYYTDYARRRLANAEHLAAECRIFLENLWRASDFVKSRQQRESES